MVQKNESGIVGGDAGGSDKTAAVAPATTFSPSGAPHQTTEINAEHPAVDADPRAGTTSEQNRIDFNDPTLSSAEAVEQNLKKQG